MGSKIASRLKGRREMKVSHKERNEKEKKKLRNARRGGVGKKPQSCKRDSGFRAVQKDGERLTQKEKHV